MFGPEDRFLNMFAQMHLRLPRVPLVEGGVARVQPVFVHDVARAIFKVATSEDPEIMLGQTYDIAGANGCRSKHALQLYMRTRDPAELCTAIVIPNIRHRRPRRVHVPRDRGVCV